jgi:hypothetical protein
MNRSIGQFWGIKKERWMMDELHKRQMKMNIWWLEKDKDKNKNKNHLKGHRRR